MNYYLPRLRQRFQCFIGFLDLRTHLSLLHSHCSLSIINAPVLHIVLREISCDSNSRSPTIILDHKTYVPDSNRLVPVYTCIVSLDRKRWPSLFLYIHICIRRWPNNIIKCSWPRQQQYSPDKQLKCPLPENNKSAMFDCSDVTEEAATAAPHHSVALTETKYYRLIYYIQYVRDPK